MMTIAQEILALLTDPTATSSPQPSLWPGPQKNGDPLWNHPLHTHPTSEKEDPESLLPLEAGGQSSPLEESQHQVLALLGPQPCHIDEIAERADISSQKTSSVLLQLELQGLVIAHPGMYYRKMT